MTEENATWDDTHEENPAGDAQPEAAEQETTTKASEPVEIAEPEVLVLDESRPFGRMQNCPGVHYVQDGNLFGVDKGFVGTQQEIF